MKTKIITICGSLKFKELMNDIAIKLELENNIVLTPIIPNDNILLKKEEQEKLGQIHKEKIKISDAIYVINPNNYIGDSTKSEISLAQQLNKEIIYYQK